MEVSSHLHTPTALPPRSRSGTYRIEDFVGLRAGWDVLEKTIITCFARIRTPDQPFSSVPTPLPRFIREMYLYLSDIQHILQWSWTYTSDLQNIKFWGFWEDKCKLGSSGLLQTAVCYRVTKTVQKITEPISMLELKQTERVQKGLKELHRLTMYWIYGSDIRYILRRINTNWFDGLIWLVDSSFEDWN
jgi:hypothetical protein